MRTRIFLEGRDAHQPLDLQPVLTAAPLHEGHRLARVDAGLLLLQPGIDLDVEARAPALLVHLLGQFPGDLFAVDRLDDVEQRHRLLGLVGLQRADQMQFDVGEFRLQRRPFALRLLHPVFAEDALAGLDHRADVILAESLGDGDQRDRARLAPGLFSAFAILPRTSSRRATASCIEVSHGCPRS
jgi:hypothetical protein